jgi:type II secretory pathway pseudopilin PulG
MKADDLRDDRGESLIEILVALSIMAVAVAVIIGGIAASIRIADIHRKQAAAGAYARDFVESIETKVNGSNAYVACAGANEAAARTGYLAAYAVPAGYQAAVTNVEYWNGTSFVDACATGTTDIGVQRVTVAVNSADQRATESLTVVIRRPCPKGTAC